MPNLFAVPVFFVCFRECLEATIIVAIMLSFLKQNLGHQPNDALMYKLLVRQVWLGVGIAALMAIIVGVAMIGVFYGLKKNYFKDTKGLWSGIFGLITAILITVMGAAMLRVSKLQDKWKLKLAKALEKQHVQGRTRRDRLKTWTERYAMFIIPFITVLREGLEAVVFVGGVGVSLPPSSFPIAGITGIALGCLIGYLVYRGGNAASLRIFMIISTCFLYLFGAGTFSKVVLTFQDIAWKKSMKGKKIPTSGPNSSDMKHAVWHVECCTSKHLGWCLFHSILGWETTATDGSIISYNLYWLAVSLWFMGMRYKEVYGHWPLLKVRSPTNDLPEEGMAVGSTSDERNEVKAGGVELKEVVSGGINRV